MPIIVNGPNPYANWQPVQGTDGKWYSSKRLADQAARAAARDAQNAASLAKSPAASRIVAGPNILGVPLGTTSKTTSSQAGTTTAAKPVIGPSTNTATSSIVAGPVPAGQTNTTTQAATAAPPPPTTNTATKTTQAAATPSYYYDINGKQIQLTDTQKFGKTMAGEMLWDSAANDGKGGAVHGWYKTPEDAAKDKAMYERAKNSRVVAGPLTVEQNNARIDEVLKGKPDGLINTPPAETTPPPQAQTPPPQAQTPPPQAQTPPPQAQTPPPVQAPPPDTQAGMINTPQYKPGQTEQFSNEIYAKAYAAASPQATYNMLRDAGLKDDEIAVWWNATHDFQVSPESVTEVLGSQYANTNKNTTQEVDQKTMTIQGQIQNLLGTDGRGNYTHPVIRQAVDRAMAAFAGRGLLNSSMAQEAAMEAAISKAIEIAGPDAQTYFKQSNINQDWTNRLFENQQTQNFTKENAQLAQDYKRELMQLEQTYATQNVDRQQSFALQQNFLQGMSNFQSQYNQNIQAIQSSNMTPADKTAAIQDLTTLFAGQKRVWAAAFEAMPQWNKEWSSSWDVVSGDTTSTQWSPVTYGGQTYDTLESIPDGTLLTMVKELVNDSSQVSDAQYEAMINEAKRRGLQVG